MSGCSATLCVHPLDVVRVAVQLDGQGAMKYSGPFAAAADVYKTRGLVRGLYTGIQAGIFRQVAYGMPRLAMYPAFLAKLKGEDATVSTAKKLAAGCAAGGIASFAGCPSEVALVRMNAEALLPPSERASLRQLLRSRVAEAGLGSLWAGAGPTVARACLLNAGQLGIYSEAKEQMTTLGFSGIPLMFCSSLVASVAAVGLSCPADVIKSRVQNSSGASAVAVVKEAIQFEGPLALWRGMGPSVLKLAPHTVVSMIVLEKLSAIFLGVESM